MLSPAFFHAVEIGIEREQMDDDDDSLQTL